jgi:hypothetical protein
MSEASLYVNQRVVAARGGIKAVVKATRARESSQNMESEGGGGAKGSNACEDRVNKGLQGCLTKMHPPKTLP